MLRLIKSTSLACALVVVLTQAVAAQAPHATITIEATRTGLMGTFEASGAFTDVGTFVVQNPIAGGPGPGRFLNIHSTETFTGAAGTFTMVRKVTAIWGDDPSIRTLDGNWVVISGTGAYEGLHAHGTLSGIVQGFPPAEVFELTYTGKADND